MRKADFKARVKKIEIVNRVLTDGWAQSIRVVLEDIDLTNENLLELKQFRPNENVVVEITPVQVNLFDMGAAEKGQKKEAGQSGELVSDDGEDEEFLSFAEGEEEVQGGVIKEWKFNAG
ncbi:MAG TPA: hypothetical protein PL078_06220 [Bacillota bacterium]|nr:hypothetical protein [Bacillota bacterium]HPZ43585.1 hypothetical protein [Bacillota bacterium]HQD75985.1 hypothetical protein [Bacillota bacterium]HUM58314.1 hypothetical protein [Bacillota bacterium]